MKIFKDDDFMESCWNNIIAHWNIQKEIDENDEKSFIIKELFE